MARFRVEFDNVQTDRLDIDCLTVDEARNMAIGLLGQYLQEHPEFAWNKHWRVDLKDGSGRLILHIVVATVEAAKSLNLASYQQ